MVRTDIRVLNPKCDKCGLCSIASRVCIPGRGVAKPRILFVGQAPGEAEDEKGSVFVGPAGELLQQAIDEYDLNPHYITNAVKCFPGKKLAGGGDNEPTKKQIEACKPYLFAEINALKPEVIVCLGNVALKAVAGKTGITSFAGRVVGKLGCSTIFGLLHPSYILRSPNQLSRFESDCKGLRTLLHPEEVRSHPRVTEVTPDGMRKALGQLKPPIAFDFETTDKEFRGNHLRCYSASDGDRSYWLDCEKYGAGALAVLRDFLRSPVEKVAQNLIFETRWSLGLFGFAPAGLRYDTFLSSHAIDESGPKGLEVMAAKWCDAPPWDIHHTMIDNKWTYRTVPMKILGPYNALDSLYTRRVHDKTWPMVPASGKRLLAETLRPMAVQCAKFQHRGMKLDRAWIAEVTKRYKQEQAAEAKAFRATREVQLFEAKLLAEKKQLNMNSPVQIGRLFFRRMKLPVFERTKGGKPSTREPALLRIPNPPKPVTHYLAWKGKQTIIHNYLEKFPTYCDERDIIHPDCNPSRQVTGRISSTEPPVTTIPHEDLIRGMIISRWKGGKIVSSDYKQLELYLIASESGDEAFIRAIVNKEDAHKNTAVEIWGEEARNDDDKRAIAKRINFGIVYGVTEYKIAREFNIPIDEAAMIISRFKRAHPKIFLWMSKVHLFTQRNGYIENRFGRRRHFPGIQSLEQGSKELAAAFREAGNFPIQSAGADITSTACLALERAMRKAKMQSLIISHDHDALKVDTHPKEVHLVQDMVVTAMEKDAKAKCPWLRVPLRVDVKVTDRWGGAEDPWKKA